MFLFSFRRSAGTHCPRTEDTSSLPVYNEIKGLTYFHLVHFTDWSYCTANACPNMSVNASTCERTFRVQAIDAVLQVPAGCLLTTDLVRWC